MSISRFIDNRVTRTTLIALAVILLDLNPRMSTSARLLPESFTKGKYSAIIYYIIMLIFFHLVPLQKSNID